MLLWRRLIWSPSAHLPGCNSQSTAGAPARVRLDLDLNRSFNSSIKVWKRKPAKKNRHERENVPTSSDVDLAKRFREVRREAADKKTALRVQKDDSNPDLAVDPLLLELESLISKQQTEEATQLLLKRSESQPVSGSAVGKVFSALLKHQNFSKMDELFSILKRTEAQYNVSVYGMMLYLYGTKNMKEKMLNAFEDMKQRRITPDLKIFNSLVTALGRMGDLEGQQRILEEMRTSRVRPDVNTYTSIIASRGKHGKRIEDVTDAYDEMLKRSLVPNRVTWACVVAGCAHFGRLDIAERIGSEMKQRFKLTPDAKVHEAMLKCCASAGAFKKAVDYLTTAASSSSSSGKKAAIWNVKNIWTFLSYLKEEDIKDNHLLQMYRKLQKDFGEKIKSQQVKEWSEWQAEESELVEFERFVEDLLPMSK
eukprot:TRINITY_DN5839_c0_g1_i1.p1 TRINITY_DN5839_c0_g1~~TRINITY_DN5839_c0_g1_i1.p1  ORF type:complete len:423 (-),score=80.89 TRINITY_DN5839_c0_g1_i1:1044-2312(-)